MAKGDFFYPFYYQRFYMSTQGWTEEQEGAYMRLLTYQFDKGFIPADMKLIKKISPKAVKNWKVFESKFVKNSDGNFINSVMEEMRKELNKSKQISSLKGKKGAEARWLGHCPGNGNPLTINHNPNKRAELQQGEGPAQALKDSNLFRKPIVPTKNQVWEVFMAGVPDKSKAREMAKSFWEKHEATGWFINGSPVVNYKALANKFIATWISKDKSNSREEAPQQILKKI